MQAQNRPTDPAQAVRRALEEIDGRQVSPPDAGVAWRAEMLVRIGEWLEAPGLPADDRPFLQRTYAALATQLHVVEKYGSGPFKSDSLPTELEGSLVAQRVAAILDEHIYRLPQKCKSWKAMMKARNALRPVLE